MYLYSIPNVTSQVWSSPVWQYERNLEYYRAIIPSTTETCEDASRRPRGGEGTRDWPRTRSIFVAMREVQARDSRSERGVLDGETTRMRRIRGNDCRQESTGGGHSVRTQVRRGKAPNLGHRDLVLKAGLARGYDPLKEPDRFASTDLPTWASRSLLLSVHRRDFGSKPCRSIGRDNTRGCTRREYSRRVGWVSLWCARLVLVEQTKAGIDRIQHRRKILFRSSFIPTLTYDSYIMFPQNNIFTPAAYTFSSYVRYSCGIACAIGKPTCLSHETKCEMRRR